MNYLAYKTIKTLKTVSLILAILSVLSLPVGCILDLNIIILPLSLIGMFFFGCISSACSNVITGQQMISIMRYQRGVAMSINMIKIYNDQLINKDMCIAHA